MVSPIKTELITEHIKGRHEKESNTVFVNFYRTSGFYVIMYIAVYSINKTIYYNTSIQYNEYMCYS